MLFLLFLIPFSLSYQLFSGDNRPSFGRGYISSSLGPTPTPFLTPNSYEIPSPRSHHCSWDFPTAVYVFGGIGVAADNGDVLLNDFWIYFKGNSSWQFLQGDISGETYAGSTRPSSRSSPACFKYQGDPCLFGGYGLNSSATGYLGDMWCYTNNDWVVVFPNDILNDPGNSTYPPALEGSATFEVASDQILLFGGRCLQGASHFVYKYEAGNWNIIFPGSYTGVFNQSSSLSFPFYDTGNTPAGRSHFCLWQPYAQELYLYGGHGLGSNKVGALEDLWGYNLINATFKPILSSFFADSPATYNFNMSINGTAHPGGIYGATCFLRGPYLHMFGGEGNGVSGHQHFNGFWTYNTSSDSWLFSWGTQESTPEPSHLFYLNPNDPDSAVPFIGGLSFSSVYQNAENNFGFLFGSHTVFSDVSQLNAHYSVDFLDLYEITPQIGLLEGTLQLVSQPTYLNATQYPIGASGSLQFFHPGTRVSSLIGSNLHLIGGKSGQYGDSMIDVWQLVFEPTLSFSTPRWVKHRISTFEDSYAAVNSPQFITSTQHPGVRSDTSTVTLKHPNTEFTCFFGGYGSGIRGSSVFTANNDIWCFNQAQRQWIPVFTSDSTNAPSPRAKAFVWIKNILDEDYLYVYGGVGPDPSFPLAEDDCHFADVWKFSFVVREWTHISGPLGCSSIASSVSTPGSRCCGASFVYSSTLYLFGGAVNNSGSYEIVNGTYSYDTDSDTWSVVFSDSETTTAPTSTPSAMFNFASTFIGNTIYFYGGRGVVGSDTALGSLFSYDLQNNNWSVLYVQTNNTVQINSPGNFDSLNHPGLRENCWMGNYTTLNGDSYLLMYGGRSNYSTSSGAHEPTLWVFDIVSRTWMATMITLPGTTESASPVFPQLSYLSPSGSTPGGKERASSFIYQNRFFVYSGHTVAFKNSYSIRSNDMWSVDLTQIGDLNDNPAFLDVSPSLGWELISGSISNPEFTGTEPTPVTTPFTWLVNDTWYFLGGFGRPNSSTYNTGTRSQFWSFNISSSSWTQLLYDSTLDTNISCTIPNLYCSPADRSDGVSWTSSNGSKLYLFGGYHSDSVLSSVTWCYDIATGLWSIVGLSSESVPSPAEPTPRSASVSWFDFENDLIYLFSGNDDANWLNDLWIFYNANQSWSLLHDYTVLTPNLANNLDDVFDSNNYPGARWDAVSYIQSSIAGSPILTMCFGKGETLYEIDELTFDRDCWFYDVPSDMWARNTPEFSFNTNPYPDPYATSINNGPFHFLPNRPVLSPRVGASAFTFQGTNFLFGGFLQETASYSLTNELVWFENSYFCATGYVNSTSSPPTCVPCPVGATCTKGVYRNCSGNSWSNSFLISNGPCIACPIGTNCHNLSCDFNYFNYTEPGDSYHPSGVFSPNCHKCPPGAICPGGFFDIYCPVDTFPKILPYPNTGCQKCLSNTICPGNAWPICTSDTWHFDFETTKENGCRNQQCPINADCSSSIAYSLKGYMPNPDDNEQFIRCPIVGNCIGNNSCSDNSDGDLCQYCAQNFKIDGSRCVPCPGIDFLSIFILIIFLSFLFCLYLVISTSQGHKLGTLPIIFSFLQTIVMFGSIQLPSVPIVWTYTWSFLSPLMLDLKLLDVQCQFPQTHFYLRWATQISLPFTVAFVLYVQFLIIKQIRRHRIRKISAVTKSDINIEHIDDTPQENVYSTQTMKRRAHKSRLNQIEEEEMLQLAPYLRSIEKELDQIQMHISSPDTKTSISDKFRLFRLRLDYWIIKTPEAKLQKFFIGAYLMFLILSHSIIVRATLGALICVSDSENGPSYLASDPSVFCTSDGFSAVIVFSVLGLVGFGIGIPFIMYRLIQKHRFALEDFHVEYGVIWERFDPSHPYWELLIMARKTLIVLFLATIFNSIALISASSVLIIIACVLQYRLNPYWTTGLNQMELSGLLVSLLVLFVSILFSTEAIGDNTGGWIFSLIVVVAILSVTHFIYKLFKQQRHDLKDFTYFRQQVGPIPHFDHHMVHASPKPEYSDLQVFSVQWIPPIDHFFCLKAHRGVPVVKLENLKHLSESEGKSLEDGWIIVRPVIKSCDSYFYIPHWKGGVLPERALKPLKVGQNFVYAVPELKSYPIPSSSFNILQVSPKWNPTPILTNSLSRNVTSFNLHGATNYVLRLGETRLESPDANEITSSATTSLSSTWEACQSLLNGDIANQKGFFQIGPPLSIPSNFLQSTDAILSPIPQFTRQDIEALVWPKIMQVFSISLSLPNSRPPLISTSFETKVALFQSLSPDWSIVGIVHDAGLYDIFEPGQQFLSEIGIYPSTLLCSSPVYSIKMIENSPFAHVFEIIKTPLTTGITQPSEPSALPNSSPSVSTDVEMV